MPPFNILESASPELRRWLLVNGETKSSSGDCSNQGGGAPPKSNGAVEGRLNVTTSNQQQGQEQLSTLTPGCLVGEMSWLEKSLPWRPSPARRLHGIEALHRAARIAGQATAHAGRQLHRLIAQKLAVQIKGQNVWAHRLHIDHGPIEALRKVLTLFASLQEQDVVTLARLGRLHRVQPQTVLLNQGDEVSAVYLVLSGEAEIVFTLGGKSEVVGTSRRGELLGEMSLLLNNQEGASAGVRSSQGMDLSCFNAALW